jgi:hypothetical protein
MVAGLLLTVGLTHAQYNAWTGHRDIVLNTSATGANVTGNVTKFPVLVRLTNDEAAIITASKPGGADIRFSKADGVTPLPYEIENWEPWGASIWVLVDTVYGNNSTQKIIMHYGNPAANSESNPGAVYDTANGYVAAWHFGNGPGSVRPSAVRGSPFAFVHNSDNATSIKGLIGRADTLRHFTPGAESSDPLAGNWIELNRDSSGAALATPYSGYTAFSNGFSYSIWIRPDGTPNFWRMLVLAPEDATQGADRILLMGGVADPTRTGLRWTSGCGFVADQAANPCNFSNTITNGVWNHFFFTKTAGNSPVQMYVNGALLGTSSNLNNATEVQRAVAWIGRAGDNNPYFTGVVDNATLANASRSADFIKLSYENQKATNTLANIGLGGPVTSTPYGLWGGHRTITLNTTASGANVATDVTNFPVLIRLTSAEALIINESKADGSDVRFSKMDDATAIPFHVESWDSTGAAIWVKMDTVKGNNSTQAIRMHWGNSAASSLSNASAVFDTTNGYVAVWHMNGATNEADVTGNGLNAASTGTVPTPAGLIGKARAFSNLENYLTVPGSATGKLNFAATDDYTLSAWVYSSEVIADAATGHAIVNKGNNQWLIGIYGNDEPKYYDVMTRGNGSWNQAASNASGNEITAQTGVNTWRHVVGTWKGSGTPQDTARLFINGVLVNQTVFADIANEGDGRVLTNNVHIGVLGDPTVSRPFVGRIDEVTASKVVRSPAFIKLSYENQKPGNSLVDIGTFIQPTAPNAPSGVTATASTTTTGVIGVSWTAPNSNGGSAITSYTVTSTPGSLSCQSFAPTTTCSVSGLTAGTFYTFTVVATNVIGNSVASAPSTAVQAPTSLMPGSFTIRMDGSKPYTYRMPASVAAATEELTMTIVNVHGKRVWSKTINPADTRVNELTWDGRNLSGTKVAAGMYIVRIAAKMNGKTITSEHKGVNLK